MLKLTEIAKKCEIVKHVVNKNKNLDEYIKVSSILPKEDIKKAYDVISSWPEYRPTPLIELNKIAQFCGVKSVLFKDESQRFDLKSFKALGGAYAVADLARDFILKGGKVADYVVTTATDGNHGRSVAWGAKLAGCKAKIYIHAHVSKSRETAMQELGAEVIKINGNYEASLSACKSDAEKNGWHIVSDTSWEGYTDIPRQVMAGYSVIATECLSQLEGINPSHAFLPVGVGGLAGGVTAPFLHHMKNELFKVISVESNMSACFLESIESNRPTLVEIKEETLMAGLSCGEVSKIAWDLLKPLLSDSICITDKAVAPIMHLFASGKAASDTQNELLSIEAGECSTSGLAALLAICNDERVKAEMGLNKDSVVLLVGTEGATDPELYAKLIKPE